MPTSSQSLDEINHGNRNLLWSWSLSFNRLNITENWAVYGTESKSVLLADILAIAEGRKPGSLVKGAKSKTNNPRNCSQCFYLTSSNKRGMIQTLFNTSLESRGNTATESPFECTTFWFPINPCDYRSGARPMLKSTRQVRARYDYGVTCLFIFPLTLNKSRGDCCKLVPGLITNALCSHSRQWLGFWFLDTRIH